MLDGLAVFEQGHGVELHVDALLHAFDHASVEVREELTAQGGRSALLSAGFDVGALTNGMGWYLVWARTTPEKKSRVSPKSMNRLGRG